MFMGKRNRLSLYSPSLSRVARGELCAGCGACAALAPGKVTMVRTRSGYLRPLQSASLDCSEEANISEACPGLGQTVETNNRPNPVLWGPYREVMTGWATNPELRFSGSSGGGISALLVYLIETNFVDAVVQTAADPHFVIGNTTLITTDTAGITKAAGSRYAPSAPLEGLPELLIEHAASGRRFAFVGKPCDVAALRAMQAMDVTIANAFPIVLSFFCAGVPSHVGVERVLEALGTNLSKTTRFRFRGNGWPGRATALDKNGIERSMSYHNSWGKILSKHVQHRCKICADGTGTAADIVCADAWTSDAAGYPIFDDAPGVSLIMARSDLGAKLVAEARSAGHIQTEVFDIADLAAIQPGQRERRRALLARLLALKMIGRPIPHYVGLQLMAAARQNSVARNVRNFLGTLRRALHHKR